jgi:hypothetical protein
LPHGFTQASVQSRGVTSPHGLDRLCVANRGREPEK